MVTATTFEEPYFNAELFRGYAGIVGGSTMNLANELAVVFSLPRLI